MKPIPSPTLLHLAGTPDPALQAYVLRNLGLADPDALQRNMRGVLEHLKQFDAATANEVVRDLNTRKVAGLPRLLLHLLWEDARPEVQAVALHVLGQQADRSELLPELLRLRRHLQDPRALSALVLALGRIGRDLPFKLFKPFLAHTDARVRANALEVLLERIHPRLSEVFAVMVNDPSARVRSLSAAALWRLGNPVLVSLLEETEDPRARASVAFAAGRVGQDPRLADALFAIAGNQKCPESLRARAAESLGRAAGRGDLPRVIGLAYKAAEPELRRQLIDSAAAIDSLGAAAYLTKVLEKLEATLRVRQIASTLSLLGGLPVQPEPAVLVPYLEHPDARVAANAVLVLGKRTGSPAVTAVLNRSLAHPAPRVAANAAVVLWRQGIVSAFSRLRELASQGATAARASAAWALGQIGGLVAQDLARPMLDDPEESVRRWAFLALK
ncbi:MAG: HEAT repeat domain-containing protein [Candidatus Wallbacteria bacterium]|nr:HEAT repeat domain-containing protein [Candidatus Wallbacteria bacterium]